MKTRIFISLFIVGGILFTEQSCKSVAKAAVKHWTKKQVKSFKKNCQEKVSSKFDEENATSFCDCATGTLSEKYPDFEKANALSMLQLITEAAGCVKQH